MSLVTPTSSTTNSIPASYDPLAAMSLSEGRFAQAPLDTLLEKSNTNADEVEAMEIEPVDIRAMAFGPQHFGGRMDSGLEDMFGHALQLDKDSPPSHSRTSKHLVGWGVTVMIILHVLLLLILWNPAVHLLGRVVWTNHELGTHLLIKLFRRE